MGEYIHCVSAKALVIQDGKLLCQHKRKVGKSYYSLPGGTQESGESLQETLQRECIEEIDTAVDIGELVWVFEDRIVNAESTRYKIDIVFCCNIPRNYSPRNGVIPDPNQQAVVWLPLDKVRQERFKPVEVYQAIKYLDMNHAARYCFSER